MKKIILIILLSAFSLTAETIYLNTDSVEDNNQTITECPANTVKSKTDNYTMCLLSEKEKNEWLLICLNDKLETKGGYVNVIKKDGRLFFGSPFVDMKKLIVRTR